MKLQRKALKTLKQWKTTPDHKPLLIRGARQTGKTWLVNEFANGQYDNIVSVDSCSGHPYPGYSSRILTRNE